MPYYNRPILVQNALRSILASHKHYPHWKLGFCDDGSRIPGRPIVEGILHDHLDKVTFVETGMSFQDKIEQGLVLGKMANYGISTVEADVAIVLSDDDELVPTYLRDLSGFFDRHPDIAYCYSNIYIHNPFMGIRTVGHRYRYDGPIDPRGKVDASQVAWRIACCKERGAWFKESTKLVPGKPWVADTDRSFFEELYLKCGPCQPTGLFSQYKGIHDYQLLWHKNVSEAALLEYNAMVERLGGVKF